MHFQYPALCFPLLMIVGFDIIFVCGWISVFTVWLYQWVFPFVSFLFLVVAFSFLPAAAAAAKSLQSCPTLCDPRDGSPPGSPIPGILQARILEGVSVSVPKESSQPRDWTCVSCIGRWILHHSATMEACVCACVCVCVCKCTLDCFKFQVS